MNMFPINNNILHIMKIPSVNRTKASLFKQPMFEAEINFSSCFLMVVLQQVQYNLTSAINNHEMPLQQVESGERKRNDA